MKLLPPSSLTEPGSNMSPRHLFIKLNDETVSLKGYKLKSPSLKIMFTDLLIQ